MTHPPIPAPRTPPRSRAVVCLSSLPDVTVALEDLRRRGFRPVSVQQHQADTWVVTAERDLT